MTRRGGFPRERRGGRFHERTESMDWRTLPKIDAHVHILPREVHEMNKGAYDEFSFAKEQDHVKLMEKYHIERAVIMTFNDPFLLSNSFTADAVHRNLAEICAAHPGRYFAATDIDARNSAAVSCAAIEKAFAGEKCFKCVKIHPDNAGRSADYAYYDPIVDLAVQLGVPVAIHSNPSGEPDDRAALCAPARIKALQKRHPDMKLVVCHLGGFQWEDALELDAHFDLSFILPELADRYGIAETNRILRRFGAERLLYGSDWPCGRSVPTNEIYERTFNLLDQMDFTADEARMIAYDNAVSVFALDN